MESAFWVAVRQSTPADWPCGTQPSQRRSLKSGCSDTCSSLASGRQRQTTGLRQPDQLTLDARDHVGECAPGHREHEDERDAVEHGRAGERGADKGK